jgi:hypothetical protein
MRQALWLSAGYNFGGAAMFALPASPLGQLAGLPSEVPLVYRVMLAFFVALFGGAYAWLARAPEISRPMVALCAIGKACAFALIVVLWLAGAAAGMGVLLAIGDLVLAAVFTRWLQGSSA